MMKEKLLVPVLMILHFCVLSSQTIDFDKDFGINYYPFNAEGSCLQTKDTGVIFSSTKEVFKLDSNGDLLWKKPLDLIVKSIKESGDGSLIVLHERSIKKLDETGNILWEKDYKDTSSNEFDVMAVINDTIYVIGRTEYNVLFLAYDSQGNACVEKTIKVPGTQYIWYFNEAALTNDSCLLAGGVNNEYFGLGMPEGEALLLKFNLDGDTIWHKYYHSDGYRSINHLSIDAYANIYFLSWMSDIIKTDSAGNKLWEKRLDFLPYSDVNFFILRDSILTFVSANPSRDSLSVYELDTAGTQLSSKILTVSSKNEFEYAFFDLTDLENDVLYLLGGKQYSHSSSFFVQKYNKDWEICHAKNLPASISSGYRNCNLSDTIIIQIDPGFSLSESNVFTLQLSDSNGIFSDPVNLINIDTSSTFQWNIPVSEFIDKIRLNDFYYARIISSDNSLTSKSFFTLFAETPVYLYNDYYANSILYGNNTLTSSDDYCFGEELYLTLTKNPGYTGGGNDNISWNMDGNYNFAGYQSHPNTRTQKIVSWSDTGTYKINMSISNMGCNATLVDSVVFKPVPEVELFFEPDPTCPNVGKVYVSGDTNNLQYQWIWNEAVIDSGSHSGPYYIHWETAKKNQYIDLTAYNNYGCKNGDRIYYNLGSDERFDMVSISYGDNNRPVIYWDDIPEVADSVFIYKTNGLQTIQLRKGTPEYFNNNCIIDNDTIIQNLGCFEDTAPLDTSMYYYMYYTNNCGWRSWFVEVKPIYLDYQLMGDQVQLRWSKYGGIGLPTYYLYKGSTVDHIENVIGSFYNNLSSSQSLEGDTTYYRIKAIGYSGIAGANVSTYSNIVAVKSNTAGFDNNIYENDIHLRYLQNGQYLIDLGKQNHKYVSLKVMNMMGKVVYEKQIKNETELFLDLNNRASGVYLIVLSDNTIVNSVKLFHSYH